MKTISIITMLILTSPLYSNDIDKRAEDEMDFLLKSSKTVQVHLLDIEEERKEDIDSFKNKLSKSDIGDTISTSAAAPIRKNRVGDLNKILEIHDSQVLSVKNIRKRGL